MRYWVNILSSVFEVQSGVRGSGHLTGQGHTVTSFADPQRIGLCTQSQHLQTRIQILINKHQRNTYMYIRFVGLYTLHTNASTPRTPVHREESAASVFSGCLAQIFTTQRLSESQLSSPDLAVGTMAKYWRGENPLQGPTGHTLFFRLVCVLGAFIQPASMW